MADPKYADLPGIARDEPDVYETSDLPESDQAPDYVEEENESIERLQISASEAFGKFKGKSLNANRVDFSDRISKHLRTGYDARSGDWVLVGEGEKETPLQKYNRLQCELNELLEEVSEIQKKKTGNEEPDYLLSEQQVRDALTKLLDLKLEESLGVDVVEEISDPHAANLKKLQSQLEQFKKSVPEKDDASAKESQAGDGSIVYKLNYRPELARYNQTNRLAEMESRLHKLETIFGATDERIEKLASLSSKGTLMDTAQHLCATASLLDPAQLDHIEGRLIALTQKLDSIAEKKAALGEDDEDKDKKIDELYTIIKDCEPLTKVVPQTIDRLKSLDALHKKATNFSKTMVQLERVQGEICGNIENNKALLKGVQESFSFNLEEIHKTTASLDARIKALAEKQQKHKK